MEKKWKRRKNGVPEIDFYHLNFFFIIPPTPRFNFSDSKGTIKLIVHLMKLIPIPGVVNNEFKGGGKFPKYSLLKISDFFSIFSCLYFIKLKSAIMITIWPLYRLVK